jgi:hypothetical protein
MPAPDESRVFTTQSAPIPADKGIVMPAPEESRVFTILRDHLLDRLT